MSRAGGSKGWVNLYCGFQGGSVLRACYWVNSKISLTLAALRRQKGLSQTELAHRMQTTQKMVDYYERRAANPALEVIQRAAAALDVSPAEFLGDDVAPLKSSRKAGPTGKVQKVFEDVSRLPRRQQEKIIQVVAALVSQYEQARQ